MVNRITNSQVTQTFIDQMFRTRAQLEDTRGELTTGLKVSDPSDDPGRAGTIASLLSTLQQIDGHQQRIGTSLDMLGIQENALTSANEIVVRAKEIAAQAANSSVSPEVRRTMAEEVFQLRDALVSLANTRYQGMYVYGGLDDDDPPVDANSSFYTNPPAASPAPAAKIHYSFDAASSNPGQDQTRSVQISNTDSIRINTPGQQVFGDAINNLERLGRALAGYQTNLVDSDGDTEVDDPDGTGAAYTFPADAAQQLSDIQATIDAIENARANDLEPEISSIGARSARLQQAQTILASLKETTEQARSRIQDADFAESASKFANLQTALQALLASGAKINNLSLLDYLFS